MAKTPNTVRGEFDATIGPLKLHIIPSYGRISRAEAAVDRSCMSIAQSGGDMKVQEIALFLSQLTKPKLDHREIGNACMGRFEEGLTAVMKVISQVVDAGDEADDDPDADIDPEEDEGN